MEVDQRLVMERSQEQLTDALLESSIELPLNILATDSHPSDLILAQLSEAVYTEKKPRETDADYGKRLDLPKDWCLLATGSNLEWINGYFGAAYVHTTWQQVVVAHRGTVLSNAGSLITDAFGIWWNKYTDCANTAITFADGIRQALQFVNTKHGRNYNLSITGHSLGGWLAQITSFTVKWLNVSCGLLIKNTSDGVHAKTVVFDSPGARAMLEKVRDNHYDRLGNNFLDRLNIMVYVLAPNYVNTCGKHIGTVNRIIIDDFSFDWKVKWSNLICTAKTHAIINFVNALRNNLDIIKVTDWPKNSKELSKLFGKDALNLANKYHGNFDKENDDLNLFEPITERYNTEEGMIRAKCYLKTFSDDELQILNKLTSIQKQSNVCWINKLILNNSLEIKKNENIFPDFEIDHNNLTLSCQSKQSLGKLTHRLKQLMRWLGQEFTAAVEEQFAALPLAADLFYRVEGMSFLDSLPKSSLNFTDSIGLQEFLLSDTARVLSIITQDGELEMIRLRNIFLKLKEYVHFSAPNEKYTLENHFTFLDWPRLQKLLKSGRSPIDQNNLMMVDGSLCTTFSLELLTFLNNYKESSPSVLKKLVFISSHPIDIFNSFENVKIFNVHRNINLIDLSNDSQKAVLRRNIISAGQTAYTFAEFLGEDCLISINELLCSDFKQIVTNDDYLITIKDTRPRLSDQQMPIFEINIKTDKKCILKCVNSPNTIVVMSRKEVETLAGWEELAGTGIILAEGDAEELFRETCNTNQQISVYRIQVFNGDIYCKQIFNQDFYVFRHFFHRARIDVQKFAQTKHSDDLFVVHSIYDKTFLLELISNCKESKAFIENVKVTGTKEREADLIQENLQKNLHFIKICQNEIGCEIEWRYSHGSVKSLQSYVSTESYDPIDEQTLSETKRKMVIITDEPGMGKTTSLANLSRLVETPWVIYIELKIFQAYIRDKLPDELSPQNVASFLLSKSHTTDNSLEHKFLIYLLQSKTSTKRVVLVFDGFDEVDDYIKNKESAKEKLVKLFNYLIKKPNVQLFLATRTYLKESLEEKLTQFSTSFVPISDKNQLNFLLMFWRSCLFLELRDYGEVEEGRIKKYAEEVLRQAKQVLGPDMSRFMGVPLQLRMLAEIFRPQSVLLIQSTEALFKNINIVSAPNLYKRFISLKYDIYIHDKTIIGQALSDDNITTFLEPLTRLHGELGFRTLFSGFYDGMKFKTIEDRELVNLNRIGLVQCKVNGEFQFVHRTYAEYFCAQIIVMWLDQQDITFKYQLIKDIILPKVLLQPDSKIIRLFLNVELGEMKMSDTTQQSNAEQISRLWFEENALFRNDDNETALHIAVKEMNERIFTLLLSGLHYESTQEAFVSLITQFDNNNDTALHIMDQLTFNGKTEDEALCHRIIGIFLKSILNCPYESKEAVLLAYLFNRNISESHILNYLLKSGNISGDTSTALKIIIKIVESRLKQVQLHIIQFNEGLLKNNLKLAKNILFKRLNNNIERYLLLLNGPKEHVTWLRFAARNGHLGIVRLLAEQTSDLFSIMLTRRDPIEMTPLFIAVEGGHLDIVKLLVKRGANVNTRELGMTALRYAAYNRQTTICKYFIDSGAEIISKDIYGNTVLHKAAEEGHLSLVKYLILSGADINSVNKWGQTALRYATLKGHLLVLKYLLQQGADPNRVDREGYTALTMASYKEKWDAVRVLLKRVNTDVNADGGAALAWAIDRGEWSIVKCLIDKGTLVPESHIWHNLSEFKEKFQNYQFLIYCDCIDIAIASVK